MPTDRDVRPSRLAHELGITEQEARELRKRVERCEQAQPQRYEMREPLQLRPPKPPTWLPGMCGCPRCWSEWRPLH